MQFFAHVGITLGAAWVVQQAVSHVKHHISEKKLNYIAASSLGDHTMEVDSNRNMRPVG